MMTIIESPYAGDVEKNTEYARKCLLHSLSLGESPFASHLLYTQVLDDTKPDQRRRGIQAALRIYKNADRVCVYLNNGLSKGMMQGISNAAINNKPILCRFFLVDADERKTLWLEWLYKPPVNLPDGDGSKQYLLNDIFLQMEYAALSVKDNDLL